MPETDTTTVELEFRHAEERDPEPDVSWLETAAAELGSIADAVANRRRMKGYAAGDWHMIGVRAVAVVTIWRADIDVPRRLELTSSGIWNVESDSGRHYLRQISREQADELRPELEALGFDAAAINEAIADEWPST